MNLEEIAKRISTPNMCSSSDIEPLRQLSEKYPFAQSFSILYLKALSINNDIRFDEELQKHAYKITDRIRLYELINEKEKLSRQIESEVELKIEVENQIDIEEIKKIENEFEVLEEIIETNVVNQFEEKNENTILEEITEEIIEPFENNLEPETDEIPSFIPIKVDIILPETEVEEFKSVSYRNEKKIELPDEIKEEIEETINIIPQSNSINEEQTEIISLPNTFEETPLEIDILAHAVSSNYSLEVEVENVVENVVEIKIDVELDTDIENENEVEVKDFELKTIETKDTSKKSFYTWLKASSYAQTNFEDNFDNEDTFVEVKVDKLVEKIAEIKKNEENLEENLIDKNPVTKVELRNKIETIVEQFIKEEPTISRPQKIDKQEERPKTEFYSPLKKAKSSLDETSLPVSETLAKIFAAQGNFPKAIYAYQQLILIYPEKKIFFVTQIDELTNKLNT